MKTKHSGKGIALYHIIFDTETFEDAVASIVNLVYEVQEKFPDQPRHLFLDIEGHIEKDGAFDPDMWEFISDFMLDMREINPIKGGFVKFFSEWQIPTHNGKYFQGENENQDNAPPKKIVIHASGV
jgi:hypothetical protein